MTPAGDLLDAGHYPSETLRVVDELEADYRRHGVSWGPQEAASLRERLREGRLRGRLWLGPKDEAAGLVVWDDEPEVGRRVLLYLAPGYQRTAALASLVARIAAELPPAAVPVVGWYSIIPGVPWEAQRDVFGPRGLFHVVRVDMRYPEDRPPPRGAGPDPAGLRGLTVADEVEVGRLIASAYADNPVEQAVFRRFRDPDRDAAVSARDLLGERYGRWMAEASFGVFDGRSLAAAVLVNDFQGPLITEVMTAPTHRRRGLATHLLGAAIAALRSANAPPPRLVVTTWNRRAHRLYRALGFREVAGTEGGVWLDLTALGLPTPTEPPDG